MRVVDAGVDDGDLDVLAMQPEVLPHARRADERNAVRIRRPHLLQLTHGDHTRKCRELRRFVARDQNLDPVVGRLVGRHDRPTQRLDLALERALRALQCVLGGVFLGFRELAAGGLLLQRYRGAGELQHDVDGALVQTDRRPRRGEQHAAVSDSFRPDCTGVRRHCGAQHHCHRGKRCGCV
jgi:hypothetical protein